MSSDPRVQLRFQFPAPTRPQRLRVALRGLSASILPEDGDVQTAQAYLQSAGAQAVFDGSSLLVAAEDFRQLLDLPSQVVLLGDDTVSTLLRACGPSVLPPVVATLDSGETVNLNWVDSTGECNEPLPLAATAFLLAADLALSASPETWSAIRSSSALPLLRARARVNLDGFVEVQTPLAQQIEAAGIPGLFRIDDSRYGVSFDLADGLEHLPGLEWVGERSFPVPSSTPAPSLPLAAHSASMLPGLLEDLQRSRGRVLVGPAGSGRRVLALAAVASLRAFPLLVLTRASSLWLWHRNIDLLGGVGEDVDVRILPYDIVGEVDLEGAISVVFDDLALALSENPRLRDRLRCLEGSVAGYRIAVLPEVPHDEASLLRVLSLVRPGEFDDRLPVVARYPAPAAERFAEHARCFLDEVPAGTDGAGFKRSSVREVNPGSAFRELVATLPRIDPSRPVLVRERAAELLSWVSAGPPSMLGAKISEVLAFASTDTPFAVVTRVARTAAILTGLTASRPWITVVDASERLPDLSGFDRVVFLEPPFSYQETDRAVVESSDSTGCRDVTVLHLPGTADDRFALLAFLRRRRSSPLSHVETAFLAGSVDFTALLDFLGPDTV